MTKSKMQASTPVRGFPLPLHHSRTACLVETANLGSGAQCPMAGRLLLESVPSRSSTFPPQVPLSWCDRCGQAKEAVQKAKNAEWVEQGESEAGVDLGCVGRRRETLLALSLPRIVDSHGAALQWSAAGLKCRVNWRLIRLDGFSGFA